MTKNRWQLIGSEGLCSPFSSRFCTLRSIYISTSYSVELPSSGEFPDVDDFYINKYSEYNVLLPYTSTVLYETPGKHIPTTALFLDTLVIEVTKDESGNRLCFGIQYSDLTNWEATLYPTKLITLHSHCAENGRFGIGKERPCEMAIVLST